MLEDADLKSRFSLKVENFAPNDPNGISPLGSDLKIMAANIETKNKMMKECKRRLALQQMPKFLLGGEYGSGKTHMANFVANSLDDQYPNKVEIVRIDIGEIHQKTGFEYLYEKIINNFFSLEKLREIHDLWIAKKAADAAPNPYTTSESDLAKIFNKVGNEDAGRSVAKLIQRYDENVAKQGWSEIKAIIHDSAEKVRMLDALSNFFTQGTGKYLMMVIDQGNNLITVNNKDSISSWLTAALEMAEDSNSSFGWIIIVGTDGDTPEWWQNDQVKTRLGGSVSAAIQDLTALDDPEMLQQFLIELLDQTTDSAEIQKRWDDSAPGYTSQDINGETFDCNKYPFTKEAFDQYVEDWYAQNDPARVHLSNLSQMCVEVSFDDRHFITLSDIVQP
tara:strand:- start:280 stop:1455 length:1176 start_codon:yes stop_codon:yes gene_type:complete